MTTLVKVAGLKFLSQGNSGTNNLKRKRYSLQFEQVAGERKNESGSKKPRVDDQSYPSSAEVIDVY